MRFRAHGGDRLFPSEDDGIHAGYKLLKFQAWAVFLTFNGTFISLIAVGILGMTRRTISYAAYLQPLNVSASVFAFGLGASMALFLGILIWEAVIKKTRAVENPWESLGVEWRVHSGPRVQLRQGPDGLVAPV